METGLPTGSIMKFNFFVNPLTSCKTDVIISNNICGPYLYKSSTATVIELRFFTKKIKPKMTKKIKNLYFIPHMTFSSNFLHAVTFLRSPPQCP